MFKASSTDKIIVDTTVMPKAIAHPTDSRLLEKSRQHLVKLADENCIDLRQNYKREAPRLAAQAGRYAHAKQYKRMKKTIKTLRTRVGHVQREVERKLHQLPEHQQPQAQDLLGRVSRILTQKTKDKNKLYALHAPEVECISKGKARTPYEFGVKVTVATTFKEGLVVGMRSMPGNPWDGQTLDETIEHLDPHEDGRKIESNPAQRCTGSCSAWGYVRSRPQLEDAAASLCPIWSRVAGGAVSHIDTSADKLWQGSLKIQLFRAD